MVSGSYCRYPSYPAGLVVIFDKKNYHVGQFIKVRINRASSATLFGDPVE